MHGSTLGGLGVLQHENIAQRFMLCDRHPSGNYFVLLSWQSQDKLRNRIVDFYNELAK